MNTNNSNLFSVPRQGYISLQVPDFTLDLTNATMSVHKYDQYPKEWFIRKTRDGRIVIGKERGFLYWSRKGYLTNKEEIKRNFELALSEGLDRTNGRGWAAFEEHADNFYKEIEENTKRYVDGLRKKLAAAEVVMKNLE